MMDVAGDGTMLFTRRDEVDVLAMRDVDGEGVEEAAAIFASGPGAHGIAIAGVNVYPACTTTVGGLRWLVDDRVDHCRPARPRPASRPQVRVSPDGPLRVSVGSSCNDCAEDNLLQRGTMLLRYAASVGRGDVMANCLRNTIGYDWQPSQASCGAGPRLRLPRR